MRDGSKSYNKFQDPKSAREETVLIQNLLSRSKVTRSALGFCHNLKSAFKIRCELVERRLQVVKDISRSIAILSKDFSNSKSAFKIRTNLDERLLEILKQISRFIAILFKDCSTFKIFFQDPG